MNKSSTASLNQSIDMPSVSALDNGISFDLNLQIHHEDQLREVSIQLYESPRLQTIYQSPSKKQESQIGSAQKRCQRKNSQLENHYPQQQPATLRYQASNNASQSPLKQMTNLNVAPTSNYHSNQLNDCIKVDGRNGDSQKSLICPKIFSSYKNSPNQHHARENNRYSLPANNFQDTLVSQLNMTDSPPKQNTNIPQANQPSKAQLQLQQQIQEQMKMYGSQVSEQKRKSKRQSPLSHHKLRRTPISNQKQQQKQPQQTLKTELTPQKAVMTPFKQVNFEEPSVQPSNQISQNIEKQNLNNVANGNQINEQLTSEIKQNPQANNQGSSNDLTRKSQSRERRSRQSRKKRDNAEIIANINAQQQIQVSNCKKEFQQNKALGAHTNDIESQGSTHQVIRSSFLQDTQPNSFYNFKNLKENVVLMKLEEDDDILLKSQSFKIDHQSNSNSKQYTPHKESIILASEKHLVNQQLKNNNNQSNTIQEDLSEQSKAIQVFKQKRAAKKIQRVFRTYLLWQKIKRRTEMSVERKRQEKLQKILAAKIIVRQVKQWLQCKRAKAVRKQIVSQIIVIQRFFRRILLKVFLPKRSKAKKLLYALFQGWRTRKIVNSLAKEIQEFVNCEETFQKMRLKNHFQVLFENVVKNELWLSKNQFRLQRLQCLQSGVMHLRQTSKSKTPYKNQNTASKVNLISQNTVNNNERQSQTTKNTQQNEEVNWANKTKQNASQIQSKTPQRQATGQRNRVQQLTQNSYNDRQSLMNKSQTSSTYKEAIQIDSKQIGEDNKSLIVEKKQEQTFPNRQSLHQKTVSYDQFTRITTDKIQNSVQQKSSSNIVQEKQQNSHYRNVSQISLYKDSQVSTNIPNTISTTPRNASITLQSQNRHQAKRTTSQITQNQSNANQRTSSISSHVKKCEINLKNTNLRQSAQPQINLQGRFNNICNKNRQISSDQTEKSPRELKSKIPNKAEDVRPQQRNSTTPSQIQSRIYRQNQQQIVKKNLNTSQMNSTIKDQQDNNANLNASTSSNSNMSHRLSNRLIPDNKINNGDVSQPQVNEQPVTFAQEKIQNLSSSMIEQPTNSQMIVINNEAPSLRKLHNNLLSTSFHQPSHSILNNVCMSPKTSSNLENQNHQRSSSFIGADSRPSLKQNIDNISKKTLQINNPSLRLSHQQNLKQTQKPTTPLKSNVHKHKQVTPTTNQKIISSSSKATTIQNGKILGVSNNNVSNNNNLSQSAINAEYIQYKKCLQEIEAILDKVYDKGSMEQRSSLSLNEKMKIGQKFNVSQFICFIFYLQKLVNELKDQYSLVSQINVKK